MPPLRLALDLPFLALLLSTLRGVEGVSLVDSVAGGEARDLVAASPSTLAVLDVLERFWRPCPADGRDGAEATDSRARRLRHAT